MKSVVAFLFGASIVALGAVAVLAPTTTIVNGKPYPNSAIVSGGKTYVSVDSLKSGGAQVAIEKDRVVVQFVPMGGRNQIDAIEGRLGDWLQNEAWRIRIESVEPALNPFGRGPGFVAKIELRNLSSKAISPYQSGMDKLQIVDSSNQQLAFSQGTFKGFFANVPPGGSIIESISFGDPQNGIVSLGSAEKILILFRTSGGKKSKDFRVFVRA